MKSIVVGATMAIGLVDGCDGQGGSRGVAHGPPIDSARAAKLAIEAARADGDEATLKVSYFSKDSSGFLVGVEPKNNRVFGGDMLIHVDSVGRVRIVRRGQ